MKELPPHLPALPDGHPSELVKLQFDYAWKWFNYHADQRVKMFNFMLIALGIFASAIVSAMDKGLSDAAISLLCFLSALLALFFLFLDSRNKYLLRLAEEVLTQLEKSAIFGNGVTIIDRGGKTIDFGILWRQELEDRKKGKGILLDAWKGKHRFWLPATICVIFIFFVVAGIWLAFQNEALLPGKGF